MNRRLLFVLLFLLPTLIQAQSLIPARRGRYTGAGGGGGGGGGSGGPYTFVNTNAAQSSASSATITTSLTGVTAGHLIVLFVKHEGASTTITASDGTTSFTGKTIIDGAAGDMHTRFLYLPGSVASGSVTYTVTFGAARTWRAVHVWEYSSSATPVFDVEPTGGGATGTTSGTDVTISTGNFTTTSTTELVIAGYGAYSASGTSTELINATAFANRIGPDALNCKSFDQTFVATFTSDASMHITTSGSTWSLNAIAFK